MHVYIWCLTAFRKKAASDAAMSTDVTPSDDHKLLAQEKRFIQFYKKHPERRASIRTSLDAIDDESAEPNNGEAE